MALMPLTVQSYQSRSLPFSAQRLVNMYPEAGTTGSKGPVLLVGRPGLELFVEVGSGPIRGMDVVDEVLYVVSGNSVYSIDNLGNSVLRGSIAGPGTSPVSLANNGTQLCIVADRSGFIVEASTVTQITDPDFPGADSVTYIDGYFVFNDGQTIFNSELGNGFNYNALDTAEAEYDPDTVVAVFADHSDLLAFGKSTIEPFYNAGTSTGFPFLPRRGSAREIGLLARDTLKKLDERIFFLSSDKRGGRAVRMMTGYAPQRISTPAIEKKLDEYSDIESAIAFTYEQEGHAFYVLKLPDFATFVYDLTTGEWHERESFDQNDWRVSHYATAYNRRFVGDADTGKIYELNLDKNTDDGDTLQAIVNWAPISSENGQRLIHHEIRVDVDSGLTTDPTAEPVISLAWSEDGSAFTGNHDRSLGTQGERVKRVKWNRCGMSRSRVYQTAIYDDVPRHIKGAYIRVEQTEW